MLEGLRCLAVIPARGGSKGIPAKNLRVVGGMSLVARAVRCALATDLIDRVVVSTDDPAIAAEGERHGAAPSPLRPAELATDEARSIDAWTHAWLAAEAADATTYDLSLLLEPTSPLRLPADLERAARIVASGAHPAASTVSPTPGHFTPHKTRRIDEAGELEPFLATGAVARRQDIPPFFNNNGICYVGTRAHVIDDGCITERGCAAVVIDRPVVNIDEEVDLLFAEVLLERQTGPS